MVRQNGFNFWRHIGMVLVLSIILMYAEASWAARQYHRHYHRHDGYSSSTFLGFGYFGYPYGWYPYGPYAYNPYATSDHRRFPDFRLPAFFDYPGALGKGEVPAQATEHPDDKTQTTSGETQHDSPKSRR